MDKSTVISLLKDDKQDKRNKYSMLLMALNQAKNKTLSLLAFYNRAGFSQKNLKSIEYDVKKAFGITTSDMRQSKETDSKPEENKPETDKKEADKEEADKEEVSEEQEEKQEIKDQLDLEKYNAELREMNLEEASYQKMKSLAENLADELNHEFPDRKKDTYMKFLTDQKKSLDNAE